MSLSPTSLGRTSVTLIALTLLSGAVAAVAGVTQGTFTAQTGSQGASCVNGRVTCPSGYSIQCRYGGSPYCQGTAPRCQPGPENIINDAYCVSSGGTAGGGTAGGGTTTGGTAGGGTTTGGGTAAGGTAGGGGPGPNTPRASCNAQGQLVCSSGGAACANGASPQCQMCSGAMSATCGSCSDPAYCCGIAMCPIGGGLGLPPQNCRIVQPGPQFNANGSCIIPCPTLQCSGGSSAGGGQSSSDIGFCGPECGDRIVMAPEECDNGTRNSDSEPDACRTDCTKAHCGDGVEDANEGCDDGGTEDGDGCSASCEEEEESSSSAPSSAASSSSGPVCGNAKRESGEECDDGNTNNDDCCDSSCQIEEGCVCDEGAASSAPSSSGGASSAGDAGTRVCCRVTPAPMQCQPFIANFCGFGTAYEYVEFDSLSTCQDRCKYTCSDTEGGVNISVAGTLTVTGPYGTNEHADTCFSATKVSECFCETVAGVGQWNKCELRDCPQGTTCQNGACVGGGGSCPWPLTPQSSLQCPPASFPDQTEFDCPRQGCCRCMPPAVTSATCTDTDGGYNYTVAGSATQGSPLPSYTGTDRCEGNTVVEFFCGASGGVVQTGIPCNNVRDDATCVNGACQ